MQAFCRRIAIRSSRHDESKARMKKGRQTKTGKKPYTLGEYQGMGVLNPTGKSITSYLDYSGKATKGKAKPPKSLA